MRYMKRTIDTLLLTVLLALCPQAACTEPGGHPPVARLRIEPKYVPIGTSTEVMLDGSRSCDELDHPEGCDRGHDGGAPSASCPSKVTFRWELDQQVELVEGGVEMPFMRVRVNIRKPINVTLHVRDCSGQKSRITGQIGIVLPSPDAGI